MRASAFSRLSPIVDLENVFSLLRELKLLSHSQLVTGSVQAIFSRVLMLGKRSLLQACNTANAVVGRSEVDTVVQ